MAQDSTKTRLGACTVSVDGVDLGYTMGEVTVEVTEGQVEAHPSQTPAPSEKFTSITSVVVKGQFAQVLDQGVLLEQLLPGASVAGDVVSIGRIPGYRASQNAVQLVLHPEDQGAVLTTDLTVYRALANGSVSFAYTREGVTVYDFEFHGLDDDSRAENDRIAKWGASADTTPPTRTSTTPADAAAAQVATVNIVIVFDESMSVRTLVNSSGISPSVIIFDQTNEVYVACAATVTTTTATNDTITMNPDASLTASATIDVIATEYATDVAGNAHAGSHTDFAVAA